MSVYVLVHGAWLGGWCWDRVARRLREAGHVVITPTLTGLGDRQELCNPGVNLDTHIQDIVAVLTETPAGDVVLVGHGYGGMVITGAADRVPARISALVYLDCLVPEDGDCTMDMWPPGRQKLVLDDAAAFGGHTVPAPNMAMFGLNPADLDWVQARMTPHQLAALQQPIRLTGAHQTIERNFYVIAQDRIGGELFFDKHQNDPTWRGFRIKAGHTLIFDAPEAVAEILLQTAYWHKV